MRSALFKSGRVDNTRNGGWRNLQDPKHQAEQRRRSQQQAKQRAARNDISGHL